jgi:HlyD family secretion protein
MAPFDGIMVSRNVEPGEVISPGREVLSLADLSKIIQTRKERVKLVYLVKIAIVNPNFELKTGMPADAWFK